jgi:hypothetical protein
VTMRRCVGATIAIALLATISMQPATATTKIRFKDLVGEWTLESIEGVVPSVRIGITFRTSRPMVSFTDGCRPQQAYLASVKRSELLVSELITKKVKLQPCTESYPSISATIASNPEISISKGKLLIGSELVYVRSG